MATWGNRRALLAFAFTALALPAKTALFDDAEVLDVTLTGPLGKLMADDGDDRSEWPFTLAVGDATIDAMLRLRGNFRRANCSFAPIRLNLKKKTAKGTPFEGQNKLKLVTHCKNSRSFEVNALEEYNAYRIFNLITDASFRVRLLRINYVDDGGGKSETKFGFVIEDVDALAERLGGQHVEPAKIKRDQLDEAYATRVAIFQYLIGNTDFSLIAAAEGESCCHNVKLIERQGEAGLYSVPYDFDMAGLVNAPYATPNPVMKIRSVRQRKYWGFCTDAATLEAAVADFADKGEAIRSGFAATPGFTAKEADRAFAYLGGFFKELEKNAGKRFAANCRSPG